MGAHFEVFPDRAGRHRWRLIAGNGETVAVASESYETAGGARRGADDARRAASLATKPATDVRTVKD